MMRVDEVMSDVPSVCPAGQSIFQCAALVENEPGFCLLVIDALGEVVGVVTAADIRARLMRRRARDRGLVATVMRTDVVWCQRSDDVHTALAKMTAERASIALVLDGACVVGALGRPRLERLARTIPPTAQAAARLQTWRPRLPRYRQKSGLPALPRYAAPHTA